MPSDDVSVDVAVDVDPDELDDVETATETLERASLEIEVAVSVTSSTRGSHDASDGEAVTVSVAPDDAAPRETGETTVVDEDDER